MTRRAVFLDRDGTLIEELGYLTPASEPRLFPWTLDALRLLKRAGFALVVVTNQGGIGRRLYTADFVESTHRRLGERFAAAGAAIDAWEYCPHHPEAIDERLAAPCSCRKPGCGMVVSAADKLGAFDFAGSWVVGDQWRDVQLGHALGARTILVRSGHGRTQEASWPADIATPTLVCDNLAAAVVVMSPSNASTAGETR